MQGDELAAERADLAAWQNSLAGGQQQGDESDYESDAEEGGEGTAKAAKEPPPMPDHPDYYGKGWTGRDDTRKKQGPSKHNRDLLAIEGDQSKTRGAAEGSESDDDDARQAASVAKQTSHAQAAPSTIETRPEKPFKPLPPPRLTLQVGGKQNQ